MQNNIPKYLKEKEEKEMPISGHNTFRLGEGRELKIDKQLKPEKKDI